jgi:CHAT domain-containing protein/lipoprotein NlpI
LGQLSDGAREEIEQDLLANAELFEELLVAEDELIDAYLGGKLNVDERVSFEKHFLSTPERHEKLKFGRAFDRYLSSQRSEAPARKLAPSRTQWGWARAFFSSPLRFAVLAIVVLGIVVGGWRIFFHQSDVDKGLLALNAAYREQRPLEARISSFSYAPFSQTRGPEADRVNKTDLQRAELTLLEALRDKPTPAVHHALGEVYLAKKQFDDAIKEFDEALKSDPKNAQLYSDLGAAWLEKGKTDVGKGKADPAGSLSGKGMEELGRSLESLTKALELDPNLLEALFNRALCREYLKLSQQAEEDWREYLKRDSTSPWAEEAQRRLSLLEEQKNKKAQTNAQLLQSFLAAYESRDEAAAWAALSPSRARTGNMIVQTLIDNYLTLAASNRGAEANDELSRLSYAGKVEVEKVADRFVFDLSRFYGTTTSAQRASLVEARQLQKSAIDRYNKAEYREGIELFSRAHELFSLANDKSEALFAEAWIGYCYLRVPDREKSIRTFQHLSKVFEEKGYRSLFAQSLLAEADALGPNEFSKVLEQARKSLAVSEQIDDSANAVRCLQASTSMQLILGDYRESLAATYRALTRADSLPSDAKLIWPFYHDTSLDFYFLGMPAVGLQFENEALRLANTAGLSLHATRSYDRLALIFERLHNYSEAMRNSDLARAAGQKITDERVRANIMAHSALNLGRLYRKSGDPKRAVDSVDEALRFYQNRNLDIYQYPAHKEKLLALMALNDNVAAEAELGTVLYWFEQNRKEIAEESYRDKFFDEGQNTYDVAIDFQVSRRKDAGKAFEYAEASRARSLLDLMTTGSLITGQAGNPELQVSSGTSPLTLQQIQARLPAQAQLLEYSVLDDKVIIWVVTRSGMNFAQTGISRDELNQEIHNYLYVLTGVAQRETNAATTRAKELYANLIAPVERYLNPALQLCIVPDDQLNYLPFAALVSPDSGRSLIEDYALETCPSATVFVTNSEQASKKERGGSERVLVVGDPQFDRERFADLPELPAARREAEAVANLYGVAPLVGDAAIASRVMQELPDADVAHFATHAVPDERSPLQSKLLLSRDQIGDKRTHHASSGYIQASEIYAMKFRRACLVVLSACQTGIERSYRGEGAIGLARPFIVAGAPLVVASLWPVESEASANLMISFHKHRKQDHVSTVEALRRAQLEALHKSQSGTQRNNDWAAFVTIGGYASF